MEETNLTIVIPGTGQDYYTIRTDKENIKKKIQEMGDIEGKEETFLKSLIEGEGFMDHEVKNFLWTTPIETTYIQPQNRIDGLNDFLKFNGLENAAEYEIIIYNRWGTEVYRRKDNSNNVEWDGKNNKGKDLPEDTYYYLLMVKDKRGASETHKGFIIIKRS